MNQHHHEAVLILSDINMPGMSGLELLQHIKEKYEKPPPIVMMITAYGDDENYNNAMKLVADDETDLEVLIRQKFRQKIREQKYEFIFAINGNDALDKIQNNPDVDIV